MHANNRPIDGDLVAQAKRLAQDTGRTLTAIIEDALREALARRKIAAKAAPVRLPTFGSGGLLPGVDLDDNRDLRDIMDRGRGPRASR